MGAVVERAAELNFLAITFPKSEETKKSVYEISPAIAPEPTTHFIQGFCWTFSWKLGAWATSLRGHKVFFLGVQLIGLSNQLLT